MKKQTAIIRDDFTRRQVLGVLASMSLEKPVKVEWETYRKKRTLSQNNLYWMLVTRLADETGHTTDEMHEAIKQMFIAPKVVDVNGRQIEVRTTTDKNTQEMSEITEQVYALGAQMGIYLPSPEELGRTR